MNCLNSTCVSPPPYLTVTNPRNRISAAELPTMIRNSPGSITRFRFWFSKVSMSGVMLKRALAFHPAEDALAEIPSVP